MTRRGARLGSLRSDTRIVYCCVYCKRRIEDRESIPVHEASCEDRVCLTRQWQRAVETARRRRERDGTI
jgi:hypothetical protein